MREQQPARYGQAFLLALGISVIIFLPFVLRDGGYFIYYGDFNAQQIPFYRHAHDMVRSGNIFWDWNTDLGVNFVGSYSFYLLFSPFFWLTLPFPSAAVPLLMAPLLALKTACAAATACLFLSRFVKDTRYAVIGSLLYAFSGWMTFNIFFNHFHDVAVFFPLLLLGVEKLVVDGNRGFLAAMVAVCALVNYWFFIGEAVFTVLYFILRCTDRRGFPVTPGRFFRLAGEALLGVLCAAVCLLPSYLALRGNPRTGLDQLVSEWGIWLYGHEQRYPAIIQSLFFPPELPARLNYFPNHSARWASLSAWMPMVGVTGVVAYFFQRRRDWLKKLLALCLLVALVPGLNSMFILFNGSYYARWYFMPLLLMALATMRAVEDCQWGDGEYRRSLWWCLGITALFVVMCGLTPGRDDEGRLRLGMYNTARTFWAWAAFAGVGLLLTAMLIRWFRRHPRFPQLLGTSIALITIVFSVFYLMEGQVTAKKAQFFIETGLEGRENISVPGEPFARADIYQGEENQLLYWNLPGIQAFHSIVPASILEFYPAVGVKRDVSSKPETDYYALRPLLSVRWLFIDSAGEEQEPMPGYRLYTQQAGYNIYENEYYLPMGFAYDRYITPEQLQDIPTEFRDKLLLRAMVLDEEAAGRYEDLLSNYDAGGLYEVSMASYYRDVADRGHITATDFAVDRWGFSARTDFDSPQLLFFSVPWEEGWSATISGESVTIEKANIGFMAVSVPAGKQEIRFEYRTPGLRQGLYISLAGGLALLAYALPSRIRRRRALGGTSPKTPGEALHAGERVELTEEEYRAYRDPGERAANLQRALNEATHRHIRDHLPREERTFRFQLPEEEEHRHEEADSGQQ